MNRLIRSVNAGGSGGGDDGGGGGKDVGYGPYRSRDVKYGIRKQCIITCYRNTMCLGLVLGGDGRDRGAIAKKRLDGSRQDSAMTDPASAIQLSYAPQKAAGSDRA